MTDDIVAKMAVAQALYKKLGEIVGTNDPDNLRGQVDAYFMDAYKQTHARSFDVMIGEDKVGTYSITRTDPKEHTSITWEDDEAVKAWIADNDMVEINEATLLRHFLETGEMPPSCELMQWESPARLTPTLRVDPDKVESALKGNLPQAIAGLIGGGHEE